MSDPRPCQVRELGREVFADVMEEPCPFLAVTQREGYDLCVDCAWAVDVTRTFYARAGKAGDRE